MSLPTEADIDSVLASAVTVAQEGVQSATVDGRSATAIDILKSLEFAKQVSATQATRNTGGAWGSTLRSRAVPPGSI